MASVPVKPLPLLRRNLTTTVASKHPAMFAAVSTRHVLRISTNYNDYSRKMKSPVSLSLRRRLSIVASAGNLTTPTSWDAWKPETAAATALLLSDVIWPAAGAFVAMAIMGRMDQMLSPKGITMSVAPLGAVSAILFTTPSAPAARKYNIFLAQIGCAAIGVVAFSIFGPGWLARSVALATSIAFMVIARCNHPPADLFTLAGMIEFFFTEAPSTMRSLATSLSWTSLAMGYYLSSVLVCAVNFVTG